MRYSRSVCRAASRRHRAALGLGTLATLVVAAACSDTATAPSGKISAKATAYLDTALTFESEVDYWWKNVDSAGQRSDVFKVAGNAQTYKDTWAAVDTSIDPWLVKADPAPGGDQHSAFFPVDEAPGVVNSPAGSIYLAQGSNLALSGTTNNAAYLWMPTYDGTNDVGRADSIQTVVRTLDQKAPCGWIIDLRYNPGGTWAAMMAGISPILGDAPAGRGQVGFLGAVDRDGNKFYEFVAGGAAGISDANQPTPDSVYVRATSNYTLRRPDSPVAILQGSYTASAGEEIVLAFRGVSFPVRTFGASTYGVTTVPYGIYMADAIPGADSSYLNIVGAIDFDRTGQLWGGAIAPTQAVSGPSPDKVTPATSASSDAVVQAAATWLQTQTACGGTAVSSRSQVPAPAFSVAPVAASPRTSATPGAQPPRRPSRVHVAKQPRNYLRALVLGRRLR